MARSFYAQLAVAIFSNEQGDFICAMGLEPG